MLNTVTLKWDLTDLIQSGLSAVLSITPTAQLSDTTDHVLIPPVARTYTFSGGTGQLAGIVANDNGAVLPAGSGYLISVTAANGQVIVPQFQTQLNYANGAVQWLDALAVVPVVATAYQYLPLPSGTPTSGQVPVATGAGEASAWGTPAGGSGTVTTVSVVSANGLAGTVATSATTPAITLSVPETGILKSNGTAVSAATPGTDYLAPNSSGAALPSDSGLLGWAYDPAVAANASNPPAAGNVIAVRVRVPACTITNLWVAINSNGSGLTSGQNFAGLYSGDGSALLSATADQTANWTNTGFNALSMALVTPQAVPAGWVYVAWYSNGSGIPKFQWAGSANHVNANLSNSTARFAHGGSGRTTSLPASLTLTTSGDAYWTAVN